MSSSKDPTSRCANCAIKQSEQSLRTCGKCLTTQYCSRECQRAHWKTHKRACGMYIIQAIPAKGQGMVAVTNIQRGTCILCEIPVIEVSRCIEDMKVLENQVQTALAKLHEKQRQAFLALHNVHGGDHSLALGIARTNALPFGSNAENAGVFIDASRINHSCNPNAQNAWNPKSGQIMIHAAKEIRKGEEICISYLEGSPNFADRQRKLIASFRFECSCRLCSLSIHLRHASDSRRNEITRLDDSIGDGSRLIKTPLSCLRDAYRLVKLLREEDITDARLPRLYYDAFQITIANGDQARARTFASIAHDERVVLEGEDSPSAIKMKALANRPESHSLYGTSMRWESSKTSVPLDLDPQEFEAWLWTRKCRC